MVKKLLILFIFLSFITHTIGTYNPSGNPILGRLTYGDLFGLFSLIFGIKYVFNSLVFSFSINKTYMFAVVYIFTLLIGLFLSLNKLQTIVEILIHLFLILLSLLIFYIFKNNLFKSLFPTLIYTTLAASLFGFYDLIATIIGLPRLFPGRTEAEAVSGFRNAGQAGAYFMVMLTMLIPLWQSKLKYRLSKKNQRLLTWSIILGILFLFTTGKIAGYIGFIIGYTLYVLRFPKFSNILSYILLGTFFTFLFYNLEYIYPDLYKRLNYKIQTRIVQQVDGSSKDDFFQSNWGGAIESFYMNPITGSGIGGFDGIIRKYEVHSTYLKVLGETGIIGIFGYLLFIVSFISIFKRKTYYDDLTNDYLSKAFPFLIGDFVSWTYTYHMRKREFWILIAVIFIITYQAKKKYYYERKNL